jgi:hypothetical protein
MAACIWRRQPCLDHMGKLFLSLHPFISYWPLPISHLFHARLRLTMRVGVEKPIAVVPASSTFCGCLSGGGKTGNALRINFVR